MGKFIKLWEGWSSDYTHEFSDLDFDLTEIGNKLTGKKIGKFVMSDINDYYNELINRLDSENVVISQKSNFNLDTGASFEIRVKDIGDVKSFFVTDRGVERELKFVSFDRAFLHISVNNFQLQLSVNCYNKELGSFTFQIYCKSGYIKFYLGRRYVGVDFSLEQYQNLKNILEELLDDLGDYYRDILSKVLGKDNFNPSLESILENKGEFENGLGWTVDLKKIM